LHLLLLLALALRLSNCRRLLLLLLLLCALLPRSPTALTAPAGLLSTNDIQSRDTLQAHLAHGLGLEGRGIPRAIGCGRRLETVPSVVVSVLDERCLVPLEVAQVRVVVTEPSLVRLTLALLRNLGESDSNGTLGGRKGGGVDRGVVVQVKRANRLVLQEESLKVGENEDTVTLGTCTGGTTQAMDI